MDPMPHSPHRNPRPDGRRRARRRGAALGALAAALLAVLACAAPAWPATTNVTMVGRGWGHGIGMSQWGAYGYAKHGSTYEEILKHYYTGIGLGQVENALIRVRLRGGVSTVRLTCGSRYVASASGKRLEIPGGVTASVTWAGGAYRVTAGSLVQTFGAPVTFEPSAGQLKTVTPDDWGKTGKYRGTIRVLHSSSGFTMINKLPLESYLFGVVPLEMSASWPAEALKAQACAARSYAERSRNPGESFDVYCTTRDQAYGGVRAEASASNAAVKACAGVVPTYNGKPIPAFFFSTSGGHTESIENVWQTTPMPYLKGVDDPYDTFSPLHLWPENPIVHSDAWYQSKLGPYGADNPTGVKGDLRTVFVLKRGTSPRVVKAAILGTKGVTFVSGASLRYKLALRDTWVSFTSLSLVPGGTTVTYGVGTTLSGRIYPALKDGAHRDAPVHPRRSAGVGRPAHDAPHPGPRLGLHGDLLDLQGHREAQEADDLLRRVRLGALAPDHAQGSAGRLAAGEHDHRQGWRRRQVRRHDDAAPARRRRLAADEDRHRVEQRGERRLRRRRRLGVRLEGGRRRHRGPPAGARDRRPRDRVRPGDRADRHRVTAASGARRTRTPFSNTLSRIGSPDPSEGATRAW